jgi:hypothetical protein
VSERSVELSQDDANPWISVAREQCGVQVQLIIRRQSKDRRGAMNFSARERFCAVGAGGGDKNRAGRFNGAGEIRIPPPQHDDAMPL